MTARRRRATAETVRLPHGLAAVLLARDLADGERAELLFRLGVCPLSTRPAPRRRPIHRHLRLVINDGAGASESAGGAA